MKTKSLFILVAILLSLTSAINGQFRMSVGPELGFNFNLHNGADIDEGGSGFGIGLGGIVDMTFDSRRSIGIITGLSFYNNRSGSISELASQNGVNYSLDYDVSIAYFEIISMFKYKIPTSGIYFVFGPQIGFKMSAQLTTKISVVGGQQIQKTKQSIKNTNTRFELRTGAGWDFVISPLITITPQLTFGFGITDVIEDVDYNIHTFDLSVTCKFNVIN